MAGALDAATTRPNLQDRSMRETGRYLLALAYQATAGEEWIQCRIRCQQRLLGLLEEKHKAAFPTIQTQAGAMFRYLSALAYQATVGEELIRCRIRCQQRLLCSLEEKHKAAFLTSTYDIDPGRCYV